jgi:hypothetical protein
MVAKKKKNIDLENERYGLFMTENSFDLDIEYGRNYLQTDNAQTLSVYKVNITKTKSHSLYGQTKSKDKKLFPPVKINAMISVKPNDQSYYGNGSGGITREDTGKLIFGVYLKELEEKKLHIDRGDYIEYNLSGEKNRYYEVENAENVVDTTDKTIGGFKPYWRQVTAVPVREDVIELFDGNTKGS